MRRLSAVVGLAFAFAQLAPARAAHADDSPRASSEAQDHDTAGREAYRVGLYGRALEEFERSLALAPSPNTQLYIARSLRELGRWSEAAEQFRETIRGSEERGGKYAPTRDAAEIELRDVQVRIERGDPMRTERGEKARGREDPAPPPASSSAVDGSRAVAAGGVGPSTLTWVSGGVAVAGAATFAVLYVLASDRYGYLEDNCALVRNDACDSARSTGKSEELVAYVALGVAALGAAVAVASLLITPSSSRRPMGAARATDPWRLSF